MQNSTSKNYIIALDVGTTVIKCRIYSEGLNSVSEKRSNIQLLYPDVNFVEINPDVLWNSVIDTLKQTIDGAGSILNDNLYLGLSVQRCTFITWDRNTGKPFHNFVVWKDSRAKNLVESWNKSLCFRAMKFLCYCVYLFTGSKRMLAGSLFKFANDQVTMRLLWLLEHNLPLKEAVQNGTAMFGTVDTWLLYRFTNGKIHYSDVSNASATGMFDSFTNSWSYFVIKLGIPAHILPNVCDSAGSHFGSISSEILNCDVKIMSSLGDQSASVYGSCCFHTGDVKLTLGTGAFFDVNTGTVVSSSKTGMYPLICWKYDKRTVYILEAASHDCASIVNWAKSMGFFKHESELSEVASSVTDSDGLYFVSAFCGSQTADDYTVGTGFIGFKPTTRREHLIRAILESIIFRSFELYLAYELESKFKLNSFINLDGGISNNDFICQMFADICGVATKRSKCVEMSVRGAAFLASYAAGLTRDEDDFKNIDVIDKVFEPNIANKKILRSGFERWKKAQAHFSKWY